MNRREFLTINASAMASLCIPLLVMTALPPRPLIYIIYYGFDVAEILCDCLGWFYPGTFETKAGQDGKECLEMVWKRKPALVVTDIFMPVMTGLDSLKIIRRKFSKSQLPVFTISGFCSEDRCLTAGANMYRMMPVRLKEFAWCCRSFIQNSNIG